MGKTYLDVQPVTKHCRVGIGTIMLSYATPNKRRYLNKIVVATENISWNDSALPELCQKSNILPTTGLDFVRNS